MNQPSRFITGLGSLGLAVVTLFGGASATRSQQLPPTAPPVLPADEDFLLKMRKSMGDAAPVWRDASPEQQEQWFREGLHQAAHEAPRPQPQPAPPGHSRYAGSPPTLAPPTIYSQASPSQPPRPAEPWRRLLDAAGELGRIADRLEHDRLWDEAEAVRAAAAKLRQNARELAGAAKPSPSDPGPAE